MTTLVVPAAYFVMAAAMLRLFTSWDTKSLLMRAALVTVACNLPLLVGGTFGVVVYLLMGYIAIRSLTTLFEASLLASLLAITAGTLVSLGIALAVR